MLVRTPGAVQGLMFLLVFPLSFGSHVLVQPDTLPGWLQAFAKNQPVTTVIDEMRALALGGPLVGREARTTGSPSGFPSRWASWRCGASSR